MNPDRPFRLFKPQCFLKETEDMVIRNNMTIDYSFGHHDILFEFARENPEFRSHLEWLQKLRSPEIIEQARIAKKKSLLMVVIMLSGNCNANCAICYTDRKANVNELSFLEIKSIIDQAYDLGARLIYIPGEGEPTLDKNFWDILEYSIKKQVDIIMFTNGILFSNDEEAKTQWGMSSKELVKRLARYPIYIYHKFWSSKPERIAEMMNIDQAKYEYQKIQVRGKPAYIPKGIALLLKWFPKKRIGIEVVVEKRNLKELVDTIIPFIKEKGIKSYIEPILHAGRCFGRFDFDPKATKEEQDKLTMWLSRKKCRRMAYSLSAYNTGHLSCCMGLTPKQIAPSFKIEELNIRNGADNVKDLYCLIHANRQLVSGRYKINNCMCEQVNIHLANKLVSESSIR